MYDASRQGNQGWVWDRGAGVYDAFISRSLGAPTGVFGFNTAGAATTLPVTNLEFAANARYGFIRLRVQNGAVSTDPLYNVNLVRFRQDQTYAATTFLDPGSKYTGTLSRTNGATLVVPAGDMVTIGGTVNTTAGGSVVVQNGGRLHFATGSSFNGKNISVNAGGQLTADPGVVFTLASGTAISASGKVTFNGTSANRIEVRGRCADPCTNTHNGINLSNSGANGSALKHVLVHNGYRGVNATYVSGLTLEDVEGRYNYAEGVKLTASAATITRGNFHHNTYQGGFFDQSSVDIVQGTFSYNG